MKRLGLLLLLVLACPTFAQNQTTVTGTLTDPNGIPYYPATVLACLSPSTLNPKVGGNSINLNQGSNYCIGPVSTSPSGFFQMALYTNASITPAATTWIFTVQAAGTPPPVGNGTLNFSSAGVTISGTSQDVSTNINSVGTVQFRTTFNQFNGCQYVNANQTLAQALIAASNPGCIQVSPGTYVVPTSATIPSGMRLKIDSGGKLSIAAGQTLTINGPLEVGAYQAFVTQATGSPVAITAASESTGGSAVAITAASETGNIMTFTSALNPGKDSVVIVAGVTPAGYNSATTGGWTVLTSNSSTFTAFNTATGLGAGSVFGTAQLAANTVTFTTTLNPAVGMPVLVQGMTPSSYNGTYLVLTTAAGNFTAYNPLGGIAAGSAFGTATQGGAVSLGNTTDLIVRPEWFGAVADGTSPGSCCATPITGTDNSAAFLSALAALPAFNFPLQGTYTLENGQLAKTGKMLLSNGRYVVGTTLQWSPYVTYESNSYLGTRIVLKDAVAVTGQELWTINVMFITAGGGGTGPNVSYGAQFKNIMVDGQAGVESANQGTNAMSSGVRYNGAQGSGVGTLWVMNCGFRGVLLNASGGNGSGVNGPSDIEVIYVKVGPGVELNASTAYFSTVRSEHVNINSTFLDPDGDPYPAVSIGSANYNANNIFIGLLTLEFDGLPLKVWNDQAINIGNLTSATISGGQATLAVLRSSASGVTFGPIFTNASSPNLFTNFVVDRSTTPTTNISGNFANFPVIQGYGNGGVSTLNGAQFPEFSSIPGNLQKAGFDGLYGDSVTHRLVMLNNNAAKVTVGTVPSYSSAGAEQLGAPHIVQDTATLAAGTVTVTLTGSAVFTNATSYTCVADDDTAIAATRVLQNSGSSVTITGTGTDIVRYICVGN